MDGSPKGGISGGGTLVVVVVVMVGTFVFEGCDDPLDNEIKDDFPVMDDLLGFDDLPSDDIDAKLGTDTRLPSGEYDDI